MTLKTYAKTIVRYIESHILIIVTVIHLLARHLLGFIVVIVRFLLILRVINRYIIDLLQELLLILRVIMRYFIDLWQELLLNFLIFSYLSFIEFFLLRESSIVFCVFAGGSFGISLVLLSFLYDHLIITESILLA